MIAFFRRLFRPRPATAELRRIVAIGLAQIRTDTTARQIGMILALAEFVGTARASVPETTIDEIRDQLAAAMVRVAEAYRLESTKQP